MFSEAEKVFLFVVVAAISVAGAFFVIDDIDEKKSEYVFLSTKCSYIGREVKRGYGTMKVYKYDCGGIIIESTMKSSQVKELERGVAKN